MFNPIELITDPSSCELSASRLCLLLMNLVGAIIAFKLAWSGHSTQAAAIVTGLGATDAGVYAVSTHKKMRGNCDGERDNATEGTD